MSWLNISKLTALLSIHVLLGCDQSQPNVIAVNKENYLSSECWFVDGNFSAYLVLASAKDLSVPYIISRKCIVTGKYASGGESLLDNLNALRMADRHDILSQRLKTEIIDNLGSDLPIPMESSIVYQLISKVDTEIFYGKNVISINKIVELHDTNLTFGNLLRKATLEPPLAQFRGHHNSGDARNSGDTKEFRGHNT